MLNFVARYLRDDVAVARHMRAMTEEESITQFGQRMTLLTDEQYADARDRLLDALRSHVLRTDYHMDLDWMLQLMEKYGPIDWRSPYAMALYWASWGDMYTRKQLNLNPHDSMNTGRFSSSPWITW